MQKKRERMTDRIDENSVLYQKYLRKYDPNAPENIAKAKREKSERRRAWWAQNWIAFTSMVFSIIAVTISLIALLISQGC